MTGKADILLVDDDEGFRYACDRALRAEGYNVTACSGFADTMALLQTDAHFDVMIADVVIPKSVNGFVLSEMALKRRPALKVLHMSAHDLPELERGQKVLRKPFESERLLEEVRGLLKV